jgi:aerobic carbon-monoxide dehydrogenase large subunit
MSSSDADKAAGYIGKGMPRVATRRLVSGRGRYLDDISLKGELHASFLRSPRSHASFSIVETTEAKAVDGVIAVLTVEDIETICGPWQCTLANASNLFSPPQRPLAFQRVVFQGEPIAMVVASSRAQAEDGLERIMVEYDDLPSVTSIEDAIAGEARTHAGAPSNLALEYAQSTSGVEHAFEKAAYVVRQRLKFNRKTGVPLEPRGILASYDPADDAMLVHASHQMPHQLQLVIADLLKMQLNKVRVICPDVGGGFGIKMHIYPEEMAVCAATKILGRPVKYVADRIESMLSDVHAREHVVEASMAIDSHGRISALKVDDIQGLGAYSVYPRSSTAEGFSALRAMGGPYKIEQYSARLRSVLQNKVMTGQYRSVGHPVAVAITEALIEKGARALGEDAIAFRKRNFVKRNEMPWTSPAGGRMIDLSHHECLDKLLLLSGHAELEQQISVWREQGRVVGFGLASFVEFTATGAEGYGRAGVLVSSQDSVIVAMDPAGMVTVQSSAAEIGQGIQQGLAQIVADAVGLPIVSIRVNLGDTQSSPHGGGAWSSRGAAITGEVAWQAGRKLRTELLSAAAAILQTDAEQFDLIEGNIVEKQSGRARITVSELAEMIQFRPYDLPEGLRPQLTVAHGGGRGGDTFLPTNGVQAALVEIDKMSGKVVVLKHWVVEDCGRVINPLLVDEQIRGGVVQGIGEALYEYCRYTEDGQFASGTLADYLVPMAADMPDVSVAHVETPYSGSVLGAKGAGEAGACAAPAAILNAVNAALVPFGGSVDTLPISPVAVLRAMGTLQGAAA